MGLLQIGIFIFAALLIGALAHSRHRSTLLLFFSALAVFWLQPSLPIRSFDFWLPTLSIFLVALVWLSVSSRGAWKLKTNVQGFAVLAALIIFLDLSRYLFSENIFTANIPPAWNSFLLFFGVALILTAIFAWGVRRTPAGMSALILFILLILIILKTPALALNASIFFRTLGNRSIENASGLDLGWLGFSYIAFRLIHLLREKQNGKLAEYSVQDFAAYVLFFPALTAGPIDRIERFASDLQKEFQITQDEILSSGKRIVLGLFKKFFIADLLAMFALNDAFAAQTRSGVWMWVILYAYTFQIYFDFSGYTDIAIGTARLMGIKLPENFLSPYAKPNLTQFWNSWHMTLTQWIRAYFFNPFNRWVRQFKSMPAWMMLLLGQLSTMLLIALWHGVTINFIYWGLWHGLGLFLQNRYSDFMRGRLNNVNPQMQGFLNFGGQLLTFHYVAFGWVFFALHDPALSSLVFKKLFGL